METQNPKQQAIDRIKLCNNVLVTVSSNPSVDQLASAIGFALLLNKLGKHASAVFSGVVPSTIEFLEPEKNIEKTTDSLRDFIIALDKSKADKLRYKVEDQHVKIFITPYKTSISESDLEFSQGDFNVDAVVAIGVQKKDEIDQAITAHGRILHDATVITINNTGNADLGSINWTDTGASSLCEMLVSLGEDLKEGELLDQQIATAFLTGIVAETQRFSNEKTSSTTMSLSAKLMAAGANQQLVATKLEQLPASLGDKVVEGEIDTKNLNEPDSEVSVSHDEPPSDEANENNQAIDEHNPPIKSVESSNLDSLTDDSQNSKDEAMSLNRIEEMVHSPHLKDYMDANQDDSPPHEQIHIDEHGTLRSHDEHQQHLASQTNQSQDVSADAAPKPNGSLLQPQHDNLLLESSVQNHQKNTEPMVNPLLNEDFDTSLPEPSASSSLDSMLAASSSAPSDESVSSVMGAEMQAPVNLPIDSPPLPSQDQFLPPNDDFALTQPPQPDPISPSFPFQSDQTDDVMASEIAPTEESVVGADVDAARNAVASAMQGADQTMPPIVNTTQSANLNLGPDPASSPNSMSQFGSPQQLDLPSNLIPNTPPTDITASPVNDPTAPPPVPPPMMPPNY
ncbi:MAG: hypothetical protein AAB459_00830 [Patescibacteria group bacterium]